MEEIITREDVRHFKVKDMSLAENDFFCEILKILNKISMHIFKFLNEPFIKQNENFIKK